MCVGSCVILIANMDDFPRKSLPLFAQRSYPATGVASFEDLFATLDSIVGSCMESERMMRRLGWAIVEPSGTLGQVNFSRDNSPLPFS